jgi:hypothetical protein
VAFLNGELIMFLGWQGIFIFVGVVAAIVIMLAFFAKLANKSE